MVFSRSQITVFLLFSLSLVAPFLGSPVYGNEYQQQAMYQQHYTVSDQTVPEHMRRYWGNNKPMAAATPTSSRDYVSEEDGGKKPNCYLDSMTSMEFKIINQLRFYISNVAYPTPWLTSVSDSVLIRFIRARKGDAAAAWQMILDHSSWRYGPGGAETISDYDEHMFANCELNNEIYWAGTAYDGLPLLIIRPGLHVPGRYDDNFYLRFMVWILEKGRQQYGVGVSSQMHAIVDRYPPRYTYGAAGGQISAMSKLPLIKNAIGTLKDNYPEVLSSAFVVPVNTVFSAVYSAVQYLMDEKSRAKITLVRDTQRGWWHQLFHYSILTREIVEAL